MKYTEQLLSKEWNEKRNKILKRDKLTCQNCNNSIFNEYNYGFILSNSLNKNGTENTFQNDNYLLHIIDFKSDTVITSFLNVQLNINLNDNYKAYYKKNKKNINVVALQKLDNSQIELNNISILEIIDKGIKDIITEDTYQYLYHKSSNLEWFKVFNLHIHHKYYQIDKLAWEYSDDALITLCWDCHEKLHKNGFVPVLDKYGNKIDEYKYCTRCHGAGFFPEYFHVEKGTCFKCQGRRFEKN